MFAELNGSSAIFVIFFSNSFLLIPACVPAKSNALSVGLPRMIHFPITSSGFSINASLHKVTILRAKRRFVSVSVIMSVTLIFPKVKVAVLSVAIIEVLPRVSAEASFLTNPFFFKILCIPKAKITVIATGRPSGMAATATATAIVNISTNVFPVIIPSIKIMAQTPITIPPIILAKRANFFCKGVFSSLASFTI